MGCVGSVEVMSDQSKQGDSFNVPESLQGEVLKGCHGESSLRWLLNKMPKGALQLFWLDKVR